MHDLIKELEGPRWIAPSQADLRAAKLIKQLVERGDVDSKARIDAELKLTEAYKEIEKLTQELTDANETIRKLLTDSGIIDTKSDKSSVSSDAPSAT